MRASQNGQYGFHRCGTLFQKDRRAHAGSRMIGACDCQMTLGHRIACVYERLIAIFILILIKQYFDSRRKCQNPLCVITRSIFSVKTKRECAAEEPGASAPRTKQGSMTIKWKKRGSGEERRPRMDGGLRIEDCGLRMADGGLRIAARRRRAANGLFFQSTIFSPAPCRRQLWP
jgi:hypothetical protein